MKNLILTCGCMMLLSLSCKSGKQLDEIVLQYDEGIPQVAFAADQIRSACDNQKIRLIENQDNPDASLTIMLETKASLGFEAYSIMGRNDSLMVQGGDSRGLMYAGIDLAEAIALGKDPRDMEDVKLNPYVKHRGLRYNIPLDGRTPSYDDTGDAAQKNIATVWDWEYWKEYLDHMALNRYNLLTLWSQHPYPSMVRVPEYPDVALEDVCAYNKPITRDTWMFWKNEDIQNPENLTVLKKMTVDEKIAFWKKVFDYAEDRGIDIYLFHWNVFMHGAEGKHGIEWKQDSDITMDYLRKSVKAMLLTYPSIKGIGVTAGEHIDRNMKGKYQTEHWMFNTYGKGILDAREENPDLDVRFIFRMHWSDLNVIAEAFEEYPTEIETSFKYSRARMYSSTTPPWFDKIYRETVEKYGTPCWLNIRNDDIFIFRWGDPEYAREYLYNIPYDLTPGFYIGPDGYVWGREFISKNPREPRQLAVDKHWYKFRIWGRTAYNPELGPEYWQDQLRLRFPGVEAAELYDTWKQSSRIISLVDKIHFRQNDFQFLPEGCLDGKEFHDVNYFIKVSSMPLQGVVSISDYAKEGENAEGITPFEIADSLDRSAKILLEGARTIDPGRNEELKETLGDLKALGYLGHYYAMKVRGSTYTAMYRWSGDENDKIMAVEMLEKAVELWKLYADAAAAQYHPQLFARTRTLDWHAELENVKKDVEIARSAKQGEDIEIKHNSILWKRNSAHL